MTGGRDWSFGFRGPGGVLPLLLSRVVRPAWRVRIVGRDSLSAEGAALLVSNHVSRIDALLILGALSRPVRFVVARELFTRPVWRWLLRQMRAVPLGPGDSLEQVVAVERQVRDWLRDGLLICVFVEGALTRTGNLGGFALDVAELARCVPCPMVPAHIGGMWGSAFSHYGAVHRRAAGPASGRVISVAFGRALQATAGSRDLRHAMQEISGREFDVRKNASRNLASQYVRSARMHWFRPAVADTTGKQLTAGQALTASVALGEKLERILGGQGTVGVMLPSSVGCVLVNTAAALQGRMAVNLNFTASREAMTSAIAQCGIRTIISSRAFLEKIGTDKAPPGTVCLEDILVTLSPADKVKALFKALFLPAPWLMRFHRPRPEEAATVIFSSGSSGEPKGVVLSHHNIISNIESFLMVHPFSPDDRLCAVLPLFHSFGYTCTLWCPLLSGFLACYHSNPLDGGTIGELVRTRGLSVLLAAPTFLLNYVKRAGSGDFAGLRSVITGAEKLRSGVADAFEGKFGIRPREGYGTTELSPVAALNVPDVCIGGETQAGTKEGSIGQPIPGVVMKIVHPDTGAALPEGEDGLLLVKGPNVMLGYLNSPERTAEVLGDGWYSTGDIGREDRQGFVYLVDRVARFSKIGGEMVPHVVLEEKAHVMLGLLDRALVVTSVVDETKGEQLVVLYTDAAGEADDLWRVFKESDLPNLWKPRKENFVRVDSIPALASGKLDLRLLREVVGNHFGGPLRREGAA